MRTAAYGWSSVCTSPPAVTTTAPTWPSGPATTTYRSSRVGGAAMGGGTLGQPDRPRARSARAPMRVPVTPETLLRRVRHPADPAARGTLSGRPDQELGAPDTQDGGRGTHAHGSGRMA